MAATEESTRGGQGPAARRSIRGAVSRATRGDRRDLVLLVLLTLAIGACWAALSPALHPTDEPQHFAYVQAVAELGHPPRQLVDDGSVSEEVACWLNNLALQRVRWVPTERPPWTALQRSSAERGCADASRRADAAQYHALQPPLYYLLAQPFYAAADGSSLPVRLLLVRLLSVLLAALTVALAYLLVRELVPGSRWPARAGALALAFQPIFLFNEASVNPDALVVALAAGVTLLLARAWRRGLTSGRALALGLLVGLGVVTKLNFLLLLPSIALAVAALWWAGDRGTRRLGALRVGGAAAAALVCVGVYAVVNHFVWDRQLSFRQPAFDGSGGGPGRLLSHVWQTFLPPLPSMQLRLTGDGMPPFWSGLVEGSTTRLGWWNDFGIDGSWSLLPLLLGVVTVVGAASWLAPRVRRRPWPALVVTCSVLLFVAALVVADYRYALGAGASALEGRYIFPLIPLWALAVGCCVAAVPPRWRSAATGLLTTASVGWTVVAIAAMVDRYYI